MRTNRRRAILFAALFLAVVCVFVWFILPTPEPTYQGRTLSFWLESYCQHRSDLSVRQAATTAIQQAGTNAIPILLRLLRARDSGIKTAVLHWFNGHPRVKSPFVSAADQNMEGYWGFLVLGPDAGPAVPQLVQIFEADPGTLAAAVIPEIFFSIGPDADAAAPAIVRAATLCTNANARANAIHALGGLRNHPEIVVPALTNFLQDPYFLIRFNAIQALANFGANARPALPALTNMLSDPDALVRLTAVNTLKQLKTVDPAANAPPITK
jgi:HEAT repeats